jgi:hypothetical protein
MSNVAVVGLRDRHSIFRMGGLLQWGKMRLSQRRFSHENPVATMAISAARVVSSGVRNVRNVIVTVGLVALLASCGEPDEQLNLPDSTATVTSSTTETTTTETTEPEPDDPEPTSNDDDYTPVTVSFDPDNPPAVEELDDLAIAAVAADYSNAMWCWQHLDDCDVDRHLEPAVAGDRLDDLSYRVNLFQTDRNFYEPGDADANYPIEASSSLDGEFSFGEDSQFRVFGRVMACEVYSGRSFVPGDDGEVDEVLDNNPYAVLTVSNVWQDKQGVLRLGSRLVDEEGGSDLCDPYK